MAGMAALRIPCSSQGWQRLPADLLDCVVARLTQQDHKAVSLVCKLWNQVIRLRASKAAISDANSIEALFENFPSVVELHLVGIQSALPEQAVHAAVGHTRLRSLHLNGCQAQPALIEALAAAGTLQELHVSALRPPEQGPLPKVQLTSWPGLRELHITDPRSSDALNALLSSIYTLPHLRELAVTRCSKAGQEVHDVMADYSGPLHLPFMPELENLSLNSSGLGSYHHIFPHVCLTSLALVNELQLPHGFWTGLSAQTALRALDLSSWTGVQMAALTDANVAAVLPQLEHLTYLSLAGCSTLRMSCLSALANDCPELQHLNIASLQRSGATLIAPDRLTHLDISQDHGGAAAGYYMPPSLLHLTMSNTVLGDPFASHLRMSCPDLRSVDARGCRTLTSLDGIYQLVRCRHLEELVLDRSVVGCTGFAYSMLRRGRVRLAADLGSDEPWSLEPCSDDAIVLLKEAGMTLRDRGVVCFALFVWTFGHMLLELAFAPAMSFWFGKVAELEPSHRPGPVTAQQFVVDNLTHMTCAIVMQWTLTLSCLFFIKRLGLIILGVALTPGTTNHTVRSFAEHWVPRGRLSTNLFVGRWLVSPALKRIRNKPSASRIIPVVAAICCAFWVMVSQTRLVSNIMIAGILDLPPGVRWVSGQIIVFYVPYMILMSLLWVGWVCSLVALLE